ncbi:hypothetical protein UFOVP75_51 [uncultured Caudovirales phage]|uniref:Uncharacterized protein n=1 Tax=uncultured Caudovirales phage TaxID=2100421 RepID=A0A6J5L500_9CAUD|nr:hypothetical protein UFOVP75_51 [uncultured Caudovirales phage]
MSDYKEMLKELIGVVEMLVEQQAMPDDFYAEPLARAKKMVEAASTSIWESHPCDPWMGLMQNDLRKVERGGRRFDFYTRSPLYARKHLFFTDWERVTAALDCSDEECARFIDTGVTP